MSSGLTSAEDWVRFWGGISEEWTPAYAPLCLWREIMLQGSESTVLLTAGGVRALQKLGRYTDTERGSYLVVKLPLEAMDRVADLETGFRRGLYDTCSQACNSLLAWNTR